MKTRSMGFIGGGRITRIILQSFKNKQLNFPSIAVYDTNPETSNDLKQKFPEIQLSGSSLIPAEKDVLFIALHPPVILETLDQIKKNVSGNTVVISLAPKISLKQISGKLESGNVARLIPNATSFINEGFNPVSFSPGIAGTDKKYILELLSFLGTTPEVPEHKLEAYAIISAMLPTYFWFQWEELHRVAEKMGLSREESEEAVRVTLTAAINLFYNSGLTGDEVKDLIPVKPIGKHEAEIVEIYRSTLMDLFMKIKA